MGKYGPGAWLQPQEGHTEMMFMGVVGTVLPAPRQPGQPGPEVMQVLALGL